MASPPSAGRTTIAVDDAYRRFLSAYPEYGGTRAVDELRAHEYGRLDAGHVAYLDYTGGSLYSESQIREHTELLSRLVFGNPHSVNDASAASTVLIERTRRAVLDWFNATSDYTAVFTANATAALKLVGEAYG